MKTLLTFNLMIFTVLALSACHPVHPRHPHDGSFCPPGHAKKGHCI